MDRSSSHFRWLTLPCPDACAPIIQAIRRAKNRDAARRMRERRMNTIKSLSEQVHNLGGRAMRSGPASFWAGVSKPS